MIAEFLLTVLYSQITVAVPRAPVGGLLWNDDHVAQGFAWSPGFVSFGVPDHDGQVRLVVKQSSVFQPTTDTLWAIQTPFTVSASPLTVGTVADSHAITIAPGGYNLVFEVRPPEASGAEDAAYVVHMHFIETETPAFAILKQGDELEADRVLLTSADPA